MDITVNKHLGYEELNNFIQQQYSASYFLLYEGINDWDDFKQEEYIISYFKVENQTNISGLSLFFPEAIILPAIENFSFHLSEYFSCSVFCDASRIVICDNVYFSVLYERGKTYLIDDYLFEETGWVKKIIELDYTLPEINL